MSEVNFLTKVENFVKNEIVNPAPQKVSFESIKMDDRVYVILDNGPKPLSDILNEEECAYRFFQMGISLAFDVNVPNRKQLSAKYNTMVFRLLSDYTYIWNNDIIDHREFWDITSLSFETFALFSQKELTKALPHMSRLDILNFLQWHTPHGQFSDWIRYSSDEFAHPLSRAEAEKLLISILIHRKEPIEY
ncbi:hypothetical protein [Persicobacter diffluens]|uniref:Uncharacterized protein n=1 Tax=Persicobacter diffluens TaxID=981 RepID=A0AAN5ALE8_9BACT|nr:hypothetical protein PEDI_37260 [Persicobacter diffluens]